MDATLVTGWEALCQLLSLSKYSFDRRSSIRGRARRRGVVIGLLNRRVVDGFTVRASVG